MHTPAGAIKLNGSSMALQHVTLAASYTVIESCSKSSESPVSLFVQKKVSLPPYGVPLIPTADKRSPLIDQTAISFAVAETAQPLLLCMAIPITAFGGRGGANGSI